MQAVRQTWVLEFQILNQDSLLVCYPKPETIMVPWLPSLLGIIWECKMHTQEILAPKDKSIVLKVVVYWIIYNNNIWFLVFIKHSLHVVLQEEWTTR